MPWFTRQGMTEEQRMGYVAMDDDDFEYDEEDDFEYDEEEDDE